MNIFAIEENLAKSAKSLDNLRVVKMIVESCQILSTAMIENGMSAPYKPTHKNHPCTKWATHSYGNFADLAIHAESLLEEYTERFHKIHKCESVLGEIMSNVDSSKFATRGKTPIPLCMPEEFKSNDTVASYRRYFASKPNIRYPSDKVPNWFRELRTLPFVEIPTK